IVPTSAFRLGGLTLSPLPTSAEEFGEDLEPIPHRVVVERSALADRYMTALHAALGLTSAVLLTLLVSASTLWAMITGAVAALLLLLRSRNPRDRVSGGHCWRRAPTWAAWISSWWPRCCLGRSARCYSAARWCWRWCCWCAARR